MTRNSISAYCVMCACVLLVACVSASKSKGPPVLSSELLLGDSKLAAREFSQAREHYERAASGSNNASREEYLLNRLYLQKVAVKSRLAFLDLHEEKIEDAGGKYRNAIELLRKDYEAHRSLLASRKEASEAGNDVAKGILGGLAGIGLSRLEEKISSDVLSDIGVFNAAGAVFDRMLTFPVPEIQSIADGIDGIGGELRTLRIPVIPDTDYLRYIGRVVAGETSCTGSLVGPGLVLTNAHCIFDGGVDYNKGPTTLKTGKLTFQREWLYQSDRFNVRSFYTHKGLEGDWDGQIKNDWVILKLAKDSNNPLPEDFFRTIPDIGEGAADNLFESANFSVSIPGYSNDFTNGFYLTLDVGCQIDPNGLEGSIVQHNCDTFSGSSGAPVLRLDSSSRPTLVSVNVGKRGGASDYKGIMVPPKRWYPTLMKILSGVRIVGS